MVDVHGCSISYGHSMLVSRVFFSSKSIEMIHMEGFCCRKHTEMNTQLSVILWDKRHHLQSFSRELAVSSVRNQLCLEEPPQDQLTCADCGLPWQKEAKRLDPWLLQCFQMSVWKKAKKLRTKSHAKPM